MTLKSFLFKLIVHYTVKKNLNKYRNTSTYQEKWFNKLLKLGKKSLFGKEHNFHKISTYSEFIKQIPLRDYEDFSSYIEKIKIGEKNILSSNEPIYLLKTSGTTSGVKYIPISKSGIKHQIEAVKDLLCYYSYYTSKTDFINYKMLFLQGSPILDHFFSIPTARLSGVVYHHVPKFFQRNKLPSYSINIIANWQTKIEQIAQECLKNDLSILGGIPPWCIQLFEKMLFLCNHENLKSKFKNLSLYIYGGVNFDSYESKIKSLLGPNVDILETYPASEGFFGYQNDPKSNDLLLLIDQGIFYEWIHKSEVHSSSPDTVQLSEVKLGEVYEMVISTDSGLWRYRMGDLVLFTSIFPFKIKVVGRTTQFISAFGEHIIAKEVDQAIGFINSKYNLNITNYFVSPNIENKCYEWRIEWNEPSENLDLIKIDLDLSLSLQNLYYKNLIEGQIINSCYIISMNPNTFENFQKKNNKIGEQNKVVRLSNTNVIATELDIISNNI